MLLTANVLTAISASAVTSDTATASQATAVARLRLGSRAWKYLTRIGRAVGFRRAHCGRSIGAAEPWSSAMFHYPEVVEIINVDAWKNHYFDVMVRIKTFYYQLWVSSPTLN